jgi:hypothetical protein
VQPDRRRRNPQPRNGSSSSGQDPFDSSNWLAAFRKIVRQEGSPAEESTWLATARQSARIWSLVGKVYKTRLHRPDTGRKAPFSMEIFILAQRMLVPRYAAVGFVQRRKPPALGGDVRPPASHRSSILDAPSSLRGGGHALGSGLRTAFRRPRWPSSWRRGPFVFW